jgi:hypothetical protein
MFESREWGQVGSDARGPRPHLEERYQRWMLFCGVCKYIGKAIFVLLAILGGWDLFFSLPTLIR